MLPGMITGLYSYRLVQNSIKLGPPRDRCHVAFVTKEYNRKIKQVMDIWNECKHCTYWSKRTVAMRGKHYT